MESSGRLSSLELVPGCSTVPAISRGTLKDMEFKTLEIRELEALIALTCSGPPRLVHTHTHTLAWPYKRDRVRKNPERSVESTAAIPSKPDERHALQTQRARFSLQGRCPLDLQHNRTRASNVGPRPVRRGPRSCLARGNTEPGVPLPWTGSALHRKRTWQRSEAAPQMVPAACIVCGVCIYCLGIRPIRMVRAPLAKQQLCGKRRMSSRLHL